jgi:hypothetical protein
MKRRDFIARGLQIVTASTGVAAATNNKLFSPSNPLRFEEFLGDLKDFKNTKLPKNPEPFSDFIEIEVKSSLEPIVLESDKLFHGEYKKIILKEKGTYFLQYFGEEFGWNVA